MIHTTIAGSHSFMEYGKGDLTEFENEVMVFKGLGKVGGWKYSDQEALSRSLIGT